MKRVNEMGLVAVFGTGVSACFTAHGNLSQDFV